MFIGKKHGLLDHLLYHDAVGVTEGNEGLCQKRNPFGSYEKKFNPCQRGKNTYDRSIFSTKLEGGKGETETQRENFKVLKS